MTEMVELIVGRLELFDLDDKHPAYQTNLRNAATAVVRVVGEPTFCDLVAKREGESCAKIAELCAESIRAGAGSAHTSIEQQTIIDTAEWIAYNIRARGLQQKTG